VSGIRVLVLVHIIFSIAYRFSNKSSITSAGVRRCDHYLTMDEDPLESSEYYRDRPTKIQRKRKTGTSSSGVDPGESSCKFTNTVELLLVVLQNQTERKLQSFNPIYVDNCLKKCIGAYKSCVPLQNGNLVVTCTDPQQVKTLMNCTQLTDGKISTPIQTTLRQPVGPKGVIYNVPLDILLVNWNCMIPQRFFSISSRNFHPRSG